MSRQGDDSYGGAMHLLIHTVTHRGRDGTHNISRLSLETSNRPRAWMSALSDSARGRDGARNILLFLIKTSSRACARIDVLVFTPRDRDGAPRIFRLSLERSSKPWACAQHENNHVINECFTMRRE